MVCYADDAALIAESENNLQRMLFKFHQISQQLNMRISTKTKKQVTQFKYLGINISSGHNPEKDLRSQINKTSVIVGYLREIVWTYQYMRKNSTIKIYKTCIRPIMT
ncbi:hypothetical protein ACFW04_010044 [Cataglyphis niger]